MKRLSPFALANGAALGLSGAAAWLALREPLSASAVALWLIAILLIVYAAWWHDHRTGTFRSIMPLTRPNGWEWIGIGALTVLAFALRAYDLRHYPPPVHGDEGEMGLLALRILRGDPLPPFATGWLDHPMLFHYLQAGSLAVWGRNEVGLRMLSAMWGAACVPLLYALGRIGWGRAAGAVAAWLLAVSHLHIHFSRIGLNNVHSTAALLALLLLLALAFRQGEPRMLVFVGAGLVLGWSQYLYYGSRLLVIVVVPLLWWLWHAKRANAAAIAGLIGAFVVAYAPLGLFYATHWAQLTNRTAGVLVFNARNVQHTLGPSATLPHNLLPLLRAQVVRNLDFFWQAGDRSSFYSADVPAFDGVTRTVFWIGLVVAVAGVRRWPNRMLLVWWGLGLLIGGVLTVDAPNAPRLLVIVPAVCMFGGVAAQAAWNTVRRVPSLRARYIAPVVLAVGALTLVINTQTYFVTYARNAGGLVPISVARAMIAEPRADVVVFLGPPSIYSQHGTIQFIAGQVQPQDWQSVDQFLALHNTGQSVLLVAVPDRAAELDTLAHQFPGGTRTTYADPLGRITGASYRVPAR